MIDRLIGLIKEEMRDVVEKDIQRDKESRIRKEDYLLRAFGDKTLDSRELGLFTYSNRRNLFWSRYGSVSIYVTVIPNLENYIFILDVDIKSLDKVDSCVDLGRLELTDIVKFLLPLAKEALLDFLDDYICLKPILITHNSLHSLRQYIFETTNLYSTYPRSRVYLNNPTYGIKVNVNPLNYLGEILSLKEVDTVIQLYEMDEI